jgi:hypothetical protein
MCLDFFLPDICNPEQIHPGGGTGRHAGLKILFAEKASTGSIPVPGTRHSFRVPFLLSTLTAYCSGHRIYFPGSHTTLVEENFPRRK